MIFLDASVLLAAEDSDEAEHHAALALLRSGRIATLDLALYETTNVAITRWHDPECATRLQARIWAIAELGTVVRCDRALGECAAEVASAYGLSAYDAAYVCGARRLGATLASCDQRDLVSAGLARLPSQVAAS